MPRNLCGLCNMAVFLQCIFSQNPSQNFGQIRRSFLVRACLKIEEMPDFWSKGGDFKEKTASNTCVLRGFSTQKATALGQKDGVYDFSNKP